MNSFGRNSGFRILKGLLIFVVFLSRFTAITTSPCHAGLPLALVEVLAKRGIAVAGSLPECPIVAQAGEEIAAEKLEVEKEKNSQSPALDLKSLTLVEAVRTALANNLEYLAARDEVKMARETVGEALTYTGPRLKFQNFQTYLGHVTSLGETSMGNRHTDISKLILQQALYTFGKAEAGLRLAEFERDMKKSLLEGARQNLILRTAKLFAGLLKAQRGVEVAKESVEVIDKYLSQVESQFKAGVVLQTDVLSTRVRLLETRQKLIDAKNVRSMALQGLCNILTIPPDPELNLVELPRVAKIAFTPSEAAAAAESHLPEIAQLEILKKVNEEQADLEVRMRLPNLALQASWESGSQFNQHDENWNVNIVFEGRIMDSGESRHKIRRARLAVDKTSKLIGFLKQNSRFAIESDFIRVSETADQMALAGEIITTAKVNAEQARFQYNNGITLNTEVLNAELALTGARFGLNNSRYDHFMAQADLFRHLGKIDEFLRGIDPAWSGRILEKR